MKSNLAGTQERVTKVETSLAGLTTRVSSTETNLANLEIGGRNLVLRSKDFTSGDDYWYINGNYRKSIDDDGFTVVSISRSGAGLEWNRIIPHAFIPVEEMHRGIIVSFDFMCDKVSELDRGCICALQTYNSGGGRIGWHESQDILSGTQCKLSAPLSDGKWIRVQVPFSEGDLKKTYGSSDAVAYTSVSLQLVSNGSIHFKKVKIEYGNKATDYTEAPEDVDQQITAAETIASQTADKFNWLVKSGTNSTDFELTDRTATLVASTINMNGLVTFSGLNTDLQNTINNKANVSYMGLSSAGDTKGCWKIATINIRSSFVNQEIVIGVNHREYGYTECRIRFQNTDNIDPELVSFRQTGYPPRAWEIIKTATSTWDLYLWKTEPWDGGRVVKYINPYDDGLILVTWSGENADLPSGTTTTEQMIADQTTIDGGIITTGYISADRIAAGSITADKIDVNSIFAKDITATGTITGANLIGATGTFSGQITATEGTIGKYEITDTCLVTGSGSTCTGIGGNFAFWAGGEDSYFAPFRVGYDGQLNIEHIKVHGNQEDVHMNIAKDYLIIQDVNTSAYIGLDGFDFDFANSRIKTGDQGIELYGDTPYIDFHYNNSYNDYTSRIIAQKGWDCLNFTGSIELGADLYAGGYIYNSSGGHYTWNGRTDAYISCGNYNNTNNIYYYAGYHAFYVNGDSGSGMMYIETSGVSSRKGFRNSSDERIKKDFRHFDADFIKSYMQLEPIKYRFKDDTDISYHIGFKAQNVNSVLNDYGKSHNEQFGICATHHIDPEYAEKTYGEKNMTEVYTLAYDELIGANTFMIQKTRKNLIYQAGRIDMQEAIINDLQTRLLQAEKTIKQLTQALA